MNQWQENTIRDLLASGITLPEIARVAAQSQSEKERNIVAAAYNIHASEVIEVDSDAFVSMGEDGAWVSAWVYVEGDSNDECDWCGELISDGEGYDGLCGTHADKVETYMEAHNIVDWETGRRGFLANEPLAE